MSVDFSKYAVGDSVTVFCCDSCTRSAGLQPKVPADSGVASWCCEVCGHGGIGSLVDCRVGHWCRLVPAPPVPGWALPGGHRGLVVRTGHFYVHDSGATKYLGEVFVTNTGVVLIHGEWYPIEDYNYSLLNKPAPTTDDAWNAWLHSTG